MVAISTVSRCPETGAFRFTFEAGDVEVSADLSVCWLEEKREAWLRFITVDRVRTRDAALSDAVEVWVAEHQREVFLAALETV